MKHFGEWIYEYNIFWWSCVVLYACYIISCIAIYYINIHREINDSKKLLCFEDGSNYYFCNTVGDICLPTFIIIALAILAWPFLVVVGLCIGIIYLLTKGVNKLMLSIIVHYNKGMIVTHPNEKIRNMIKGQK